MMIIECQACRARFKLDESRITGKGARIRCRKCGEAIIVMKSDIAPPGISPPPGKELFDLRAFLREPEQGTPVPPRVGGDTHYEHPLAREQERGPSPPVEQEEPAPPAEGGRETLRDEVARPPAETAPPTPGEVEPSFESPLFREEGPFPPPAAEEAAPTTEGAREILQEEVAEPPAETAPPTPGEVEPSFENPLLREEVAKPPAAEEPSPPDEGRREILQEEIAELPAETALPTSVEVSPSFEIHLFREEEPFSPPAAEEPAPPAEWEREAFPGKVAEPPAEQASPPRDDVADAFEALFHRDREEVIFAERPAQPAESPDIVLPVGAGDGEDLVVFRESGEDLAIDPDLPGFLRKEQPAGKPAGSFDISERLKDVPFEPPGEETTAGSATPDLSLPPEGPALSRADVIRDELVEMTEKEGIEERPPTASPPPDVPPPSPPERERTEVPRSRRRAPSGKPSVALLVLLFLALAGGGAYLAFTNTGQETLRAIVPGMESLWLGGKGAANPYHVGNLIGYYETSDKAGKMFIIKGLATNQGRTKKSGIRIRAELLDGNKQRIAEKTVYAGNIITGLRTATREKIEAAMENRFGDKLSNLDVAPGKAVPFMVTFFDPPDGIEEYSLEALDGE
jgi:predicted Zn finger-like uncharacterized protein